MTCLGRGLSRREESPNSPMKPPRLGLVPGRLISRGGSGHSCAIRVADVVGLLTGRGLRPMPRCSDLPSFQLAFAAASGLHDAVAPRELPAGGFRPRGVLAAGVAWLRHSGGNGRGGVLCGRGRRAAGSVHRGALCPSGQRRRGREPVAKPGIRMSAGCRPDRILRILVLSAVESASTRRLIQ